jgi:hypothetical protein
LPSIPLVSDAEGMGRAEERAVFRPTKELGKTGKAASKVEVSFQP